MSILKKLIAWFRALLGVAETVDSITSPITKIQQKLEKHKEAQVANAAASTSRAEEMTKLAMAQRAEADRARAAAERLGETFKF